MGDGYHSNVQFEKPPPRSADDHPDVDEYIRCAVQFWELLNQATSRAANRKSARAGKLASGWAQAGEAEEKLMPLLSHDLEEVRYAAAADLFRLTRSLTAKAVIEQLAMNPVGLIAPTARLLLMAPSSSLSASKGVRDA